MKNSLIIHYHGNIKYSEEENIILISEDTNWKNNFFNKQLQIDYLKIEDYIKADWEKRIQKRLGTDWFVKVASIRMHYYFGCTKIRDLSQKI